MSQLQRSVAGSPPDARPCVNQPSAWDPQDAPNQSQLCGQIIRLNLDLADVERAIKELHPRCPVNRSLPYDACDQCREGEPGHIARLSVYRQALKERRQALQSTVDEVRASLKGLLAGDH